jgi:hypothetical protein
VVCLGLTEALPPFGFTAPTLLTLHDVPHALMQIHCRVKDWPAMMREGFAVKL